MLSFILLFIKMIKKCVVLVLNLTSAPLGVVLKLYVERTINFGDKARIFRLGTIFISILGLIIIGLGHFLTYRRLAVFLLAVLLLNLI